MACVLASCAVGITSGVGAQEAPAPLARIGATATHTIARLSPHMLRVATWNIGANSVAPRFGDTRRAAAFRRMMRAVDADVVCLQEFTRGPAYAAALFDRMQPLANGARWHAANALGNVVLSRFPLETRRVRVLRGGLSRRGHVVVRVRAPDSVSTVAPIVACTHLQAKGGAGNRAFRDRHAAVLKQDLRAAAGPEATPAFVVLGDFNAIDRPAPYLQTVMMGDGAAGFPLLDAAPRHNGVGPERYTWRSDAQGFAPGVLDYVLSSASAFTVRQAFVLDTRTLDATALLAFGLERDDSLRDPSTGVYDHLPVVVDLQRSPPTAR